MMFKKHHHTNTNNRYYLLLILNVLSNTPKSIVIPKETLLQTGDV